MALRGYLRHPSIWRDTVVFVCDDDLWRAEASGGAARRLTPGLGEGGYPSLSPDGPWLAHVGRHEQHPEAYRNPSQRGPPRRMTWLGPGVVVCGSTPKRPS